MPICRSFCFCVLSAALFVPVAAAAEVRAPKLVPAVEVLPLPNHEASFQHRGVELTRYRFAPSQERPFCYPMLGPAGRSLTRMGRPHDPFGQDPNAKEGRNVSLGLTYDSHRKLSRAVETNSQVNAPRLDPKAADLRPL